MEKQTCILYKWRYDKLLETHAEWDPAEGLIFRRLLTNAIVDSSHFLYVYWLQISDNKDEYS